MYHYMPSSSLRPVLEPAQICEVNEMNEFNCFFKLVRIKRTVVYIFALFQRERGIPWLLPNKVFKAPSQIFLSLAI